jgi:hypothetical protein
MLKINATIAYVAIFFFWINLGLPFNGFAQNSGTNTSGFIINQVHLGDLPSGIKETKIDFGNLEKLQDNDIDLDNLYTLAFENVSTVFFKQGQSQNDDVNIPQRLISDVASLTSRDFQNGNWRTVKLLQIDLTQSQDKSLVRLSPLKLKAFSNLTYILIKSNFPLNKEEVSQMLSGYSEGDLILLYQINSNF